MQCVRLTGCQPLEARDSGRPVAIGVVFSLDRLGERLCNAGQIIRCLYLINNMAADMAEVFAEFRLRAPSCFFVEGSSWANLPEAQTALTVNAISAVSQGIEEVFQRLPEDARSFGGRP